MQVRDPELLHRHPEQTGPEQQTEHQRQPLLRLGRDEGAPLAASQQEHQGSQQGKEFQRQEKQCPQHQGY
ncbi:hypothetical protein D3C80_2155860 [compost metagenome]